MTAPDRFWTPLSSPARLGRAVVKAMLLFVAFDLFQAMIDLPARLERLPVLGAVEDARIARLTIPKDVETLQWFPLGPLLDAHEIGRAKAPDEYRVGVLGASGTYCDTCTPAEAIAGAMSAEDARIEDRRVVAYNLSVKGVDWLKDVLILNRAVDRGVDAVVWLVTAYRSVDQPFKKDDLPHSFVTLNQDDLPALAREFGISTWETRRSDTERVWWRRSLWFTGGRYRDWLVLLGRTIVLAGIPGDPTALPKPDDAERINDRPIKKVARFNSQTPGAQEMPNARWNLLRVGAELARRRGVRLLLVNEPILIGSGANSEVNYNSHLERKYYDRYREVMATFARDNQIEYLDLWNLLPPEDFTDMVLHHTPAGNAKIADAVVRRLEESPAR